MRHSATLLPLLCALTLHAQPAPDGANEIVNAVAPSVASVITATTPGTQSAAGSAIVVRPDGVLLTALPLVRNQGRVVIRLQNGEVYDQVDLIGFDERRGVAALRIAASGLPAAPIGAEQDAKDGGPAWVVPHPGTLPWKAIGASTGALRLADEIPGGGSGYRAWPVNAALPPGSSGAPLVSAAGKVIGILTASGGDAASLAIPLAGVMGLANGTARISLNRPAMAGSARYGQYAPPSSGTSASVANIDPRQILQSAKSLTIRSKTVYFKPEQLVTALRKLPEFQAMGLLLVTDRSAADLEVVVDRPLFTFDYTYALTHQQSRVILESGKVLAGDGGLASKGIAKKLVSGLRAARKTPEAKSKPAK